MYPLSFIGEINIKHLANSTQVSQFPVSIRCLPHLRVLINWSRFFFLSSQKGTATGVLVSGIRLPHKRRSIVVSSLHWKLQFPQPLRLTFPLKRDQRTRAWRNKGTVKTAKTQPKFGALSPVSISDKI